MSALLPVVRISNNGVACLIVQWVVSSHFQFRTQLVQITSSITQVKHSTHLLCHEGFQKPFHDSFSLNLISLSVIMMCECPASLLVGSLILKETKVLY